MSDDPKSPAEELLDIVFFAPLGIVLDYLDRFPDLAARGRKQTKFAQSIGKMALGGMGRPTPGSKTRPASAPTPPAATDDASTAAVDPGKSGTAEGDEAEPLADVGTMTAKEAIAWIPTLSAARLGDVKAAEEAGKGRVTVLRAIQAAQDAS